MTIIAVALGLIAAVFGCVAIEKKRKQGPLIYPLWKGNLFIPWILLALVFALLVGSINLPRFAGLFMRGMPVQGVVSTVKPEEHCTVTYRYTIQGVGYTDSDSQCGLKAGDARIVYYDPSSPGNSTLHLPAMALKNELIAIALICLCLPTLIVLWLMMTHVIGRRAKS